MSLSAKIFLGLGLGIATGIFLGEITAPLKAVGAALRAIAADGRAPLHRHCSDLGAR